MADDVLTNEERRRALALVIAAVEDDREGCGALITGADVRLLMGVLGIAVSLGGQLWGDDHLVERFGQWRDHLVAQELGEDG